MLGIFGTTPEFRSVHEGVIWESVILISGEVVQSPNGKGPRLGNLEIVFVYLL